MCNFSKRLNLKNIDKSVSDIRIRIRFPSESSFWISISGCKLTILPDIQPANRIVIISAALTISFGLACKGYTFDRNAFNVLFQKVQGLGLGFTFSVYV